MPVGAYAGKADIMEYVAPNGPVYQAGTLSGNPIAMTAGYTLLNHLKNNPEIYQSLDAKCAKLGQGLAELLADTNLPHTINRQGSMVSLHFTNSKVTNFESAKTGDNDYFKRFFHLMLEQGVYLPPSAYESYFLNDALSYADIDHTLAAAKKAFAQMA
jgi:glutamate-1-semialdehyde 2,1-aminomutase